MTKKTPSVYAVYGGGQSPPPDQWVPFEWHEPSLGKQIQGEVAVIRPTGVSGSLSAGFWRTGPTSPGAASDGSHETLYSSPLGDETACVIDGTATLTVLSTGERFDVGPGSIISSPKGLEVQWQIHAPFFKKWWCIWDGTKASSPEPAAKATLAINHVSENPPSWDEYVFTEPKEGQLSAGELFFIRKTGTTGTMMSGIWRSGKGIPGSFVDADGTLVTPYTGVLGDETILLLEGEVEVTETETNRKHNFRAGDLIGLSSGMHIQWRSRGPFTKKLWVITRDE